MKKRMNRTLVAFNASLDDATPESDAHAEGWRLAEALAKRLTTFVPQGFTVTARAGLIGVHTGALFMGGTGLAELYAVALSEYGECGNGIAQALDSIADDIADQTTEPWPLTTAEFHGQGALTCVECDDAAQVIRCGYRQGDRTVLDLDPIPYSEFR